jgi:hypothetical protein
MSDDIRTYLDLSTAHVTEEVMQGIKGVPGVIADLNPYGAWLWVPENVDQRIRETDDEIPPCVLDIWRHARSLGCDYLRLDCDGEVNEALPTYEW